MEEFQNVDISGKRCSNRRSEDKVLRTDRIVMRNPGTLRIPPQRIYNGDYTQARNSTIQKMLRLVGFGDNIGSGFQKIMKAWHSLGYAMPEIHEENDVNEVWLTLPISPLNERHARKGDENVTDNPENVTDTPENVTDNQKNVTKAEYRRQEILRNIHSNPFITTEDLAKGLSVSKRTILRDIEYLLSQGKMVRVGGAFGGKWIIP